MTTTIKRPGADRHPLPEHLIPELVTPEFLQASIDAMEASLRLVQRIMSGERTAVRCRETAEALDRQAENLRGYRHRIFQLITALDDDLAQAPEDPFYAHTRDARKRVPAGWRNLDAETIFAIRSLARAWASDERLRENGIKLSNVPISELLRDAG